MNIDNLTEEEALNLVLQLETKFGWATILATRQDAYHIWASVGGGDMTDDDWQAVRDNRSWRGLSDWAWESIHEGLTETIREITEERGH